MGGLWQQEIHYETRSRGASTTATISSQFYLLSYSISPLTQLEMSQQDTVIDGGDGGSTDQ